MKVDVCRSECKVGMQESGVEVEVCYHPGTQLPCSQEAIKGCGESCPEHAFIVQGVVCCIVQSLLECFHNAECYWEARWSGG